MFWPVARIPIIISTRPFRDFFEGESYSPRNDKVVIVEYRYEQFDPKKHAELVMPN